MPISRLKNKIIGITLGDPSGVGPEIIAKALAKPAMRALADFLVIGDLNIYRRYQPRGLKNYEFLDLKNVPPGQFILGKANPTSARAAIEYLQRALEMIKQKKISALVTGPVCKEAICALGFKFQGHTEFIADYFKVRKFDMMFVSPTIKTVVATRHIPLSQVKDTLNIQKISGTIHLTATALKNYFKIKNPAIAVCGLNPHAGEKGRIGNEEITTIAPAIKKAQQSGLRISGPFPADTIFCPSIAKNYDCIIAMYHDQGITPLKAIHFDQLVNLTIGLPFIRTSPAHGTAFNIAGKGIADTDSLCAAIKLAAQLS
ncbi:MAG TPA: 4-hydroxythreonine-4-phosphate dehydrogenase PdxA [Candidatus Omnitrophota bacterium]|nr:4-hydroxythreonine-4-phosphate dehydrogenase PdxA [Candidatus Omnitrophota bacterium]HPD85288.1 4-hydroxythreonine-4-phosphate dehydrogenase PdxA [Candidatus Omnitrophota bacterium]HRZ04211.1 4-hydroxythreonine-4-phosphate dehydrogenase PdxA [Candidatus Omnitrophota bacterium]